MTTPTYLATRTGRCAEPAPGYGARPGAAPLRVNDPGELVAAIPAMLGFCPERSLVVAVLAPAAAGVTAATGPVIEAVARFELAPDDGGQGQQGYRRLAAPMARCVSQICANAGAAQVLAVIVDDRARVPTRRTRGGGFGSLIGTLARRLAEQEVLLGDAWAVREIAAEQRWWSVLGPARGGVLRDPAESLVAMAHVVAGRAIRSNRAELADLVAPDPDLQAQVAECLDAALSTAMQRYVAAVRRGNPNSYRRYALEKVLVQVTNIESGAHLAPVELAELVAPLRDRLIRDMLFALAVGDHSAAAERLWTVLAPALSGPDRADAAALLGYSAYVRGDGPFAGIALDAALTADPSHRMAILLDTSLRSGMRPQQLRQLARSGYDYAADLGIDLGPMAS